MVMATISSISRKGLVWSRQDHHLFHFERGSGMAMTTIPSISQIGLGLVMAIISSISRKGLVWSRPDHDLFHFERGAGMAMTAISLL